MWLIAALTSVCIDVRQAGVRPRKAMADEALTAVRAKQAAQAVFYFAAAAKSEEAADAAVKELDGKC